MIRARSIGAMAPATVTVAPNTPKPASSFSTINTIVNPASAAPPVFQKTSQIQTIAEAQAAQAAKTKAYNDALARLYPSWSKLPIAPYPPSSDTTNFPRTGTTSLVVSKAGISAAQLAEPGKLTLSLNQQAQARRPKLNGFFLVGAACLAGYFILR